MDRRYRLLLGGEWHEGRGWFEDLDPATGEPIALVAEAGPDEVDRAVEAARAALRGPWGRAGTEERARLLRRVADGIEARFEDFLRAEVEDTGKPAALARSLDVPRGAANFRAFADLIASAGESCFHQSTPDGQGALHYTRREPIGVVGVICPWNLPLLLLTWKVAPALAAGNTIVAKPSEETPATATLLGEVMERAGVPAGVYNLVHGFGPGAAGEAIARHPGIGAITFTGETRTGSAIMRAASDRVKRLSFELGGKNPALVFADADLDAAIAGVARAAFLNTGQVCLCAERVYVERAAFAPFVEGLCRAARAHRPGDPFAPDTTLGPLISSAHRDKVLGYYRLAREDGGEVLVGGGIPQGRERGFFIEPTVVTGLAESSRVNREEVFGPFCHVRAFDDEAEAIALANATDYGLCASVWTSALARAHRVAAALEHGLVWVNTWFLRDLRAPFGGVKLSGIGREGGRSSLDFYSEQKDVCVKL
jgi:aminomuconate-semialdehyde/2-hydroxymuconate-6-semialdehyde dehydrogenase